jgi:hypothetical protein
MLHLMNFFRPDQAYDALLKARSLLKDDHSKLFIRTQMPTYSNEKIMNKYEESINSKMQYPGYLNYTVNNKLVLMVNNEYLTNKNIDPTKKRVKGKSEKYVEFSINMTTMQEMLSKTGFKIIEMYAESNIGERFEKEPEISILRHYGKFGGLHLNVITSVNEECYCFC